MAGPTASPARPSPLNPGVPASAIPPELPSTPVLHPTTPSALNAPSSSINDATARGIPYYEKLRQDLRSTVKSKAALESQLAQLEDAIYTIEDAYLTSTAAGGNIVIGFDGYMKAAATSHAPVAPIPDNDGPVATPYTGTFPAASLDQHGLLTGGLPTAGLSTAGLGGNFTSGSRKAKVSDEQRIFSNASVSWCKARTSKGDGSATPSTALEREGTPITAGMKKKGAMAALVAAKRKKALLADDEADEGSVDGKRNGKRLKISFNGATGAA